MNKENNRKATSNLSRLVEYFVFQDPGLSVLCPDCITVAAASKNKEAQRSFIFFSSSKEQGNLSGYPKLPCPAGQLPFSPAPDGRRFKVAMDNLFPHAPDGCISGLSWASLSFHLPMVVFTSACMGTDIILPYPSSITFKCGSYGK